MPPTMIVTVGAFAFAVPAAAAPALDEPEALLAQAAMVVAARKAAPAAPMRLVFISSPLSLCWMVRWVLGRAEWVRGRPVGGRAGRATRRRHLRGSAAGASAAGAARGG